MSASSGLFAVSSSPRSLSRLGLQTSKCLPHLHSSSPPLGGMTPSAGGCSGSTRSLAYRKARNVMRVVRRFERENETNPREFSSLRPLLRAVDARFDEVGVRGGAWRRDRLGDIQRVDGTLAWRRWGRGHHHARLQGRSQRARQEGARSAHATHRTSCTALRKPEKGKSICQSSDED